MARRFAPYRGSSSPIEVNELAEPYSRFGGASRPTRAERRIRQEMERERESFKQMRRRNIYAGLGIFVLLFVLAATAAILIVLLKPDSKVTVEKDPCRWEPCKNGGTCTVTGDETFKCECPDTYYGSRCRSPFPSYPDLFYEPDHWYDEGDPWLVQRWHGYPVIYYKFDTDGHYTLLDGATHVDGKVGRAINGPMTKNQVTFEHEGGWESFCFLSPTSCRHPGFWDPNDDHKGGITVAFWLKLADAQGSGKYFIINTCSLNEIMDGCTGFEISVKNGVTFFNVYNNAEGNVGYLEVPIASDGVDLSEWHHYVYVWASYRPQWENFPPFISIYMDDNHLGTQRLIYKQEDFNWTVTDKNSMFGGLSYTYNGTDYNLGALGTLDELLIFESIFDHDHVTLLYNSYS